MQPKYALISVSDKAGIENFARALLSLNYKILSTGGTLKFLQSKNILVQKVEDYIQFPEILDGRVKTLHPKIHGGLLGDITNLNHQKEMHENGIFHIDLVAVNLYPFTKVISDPNHKFHEAIENIDIGGPSMIRSASKNFANVIVVVEPNDYAFVVQELKTKNNLDISTKKMLAAKAFKITSEYDNAITNYLSNNNYQNSATKIVLNYGENPHQNGWVIKNSEISNALSILNAKQVQGKLVSYNNINDSEVAISVLKELENYQHCFVAIKHGNTCGVGIDSKDKYAAWNKCYEGDKISIFGGIIASNCLIDEKLATQMHMIFLEIVIAPEFSLEALAIFAKKPNLRVFIFDVKNKQINPIQHKAINGGSLYQTTSKACSNVNTWKIVSKNKQYQKYEQDLDIAWKIVKYLKSNAICVIQDGQLLGIGVGQTNRVLSVKLALTQNTKLLKNAVLASDAFFPMTDSIEMIAKYPIKAIVQPGGSIKDKDVIKAVDDANLIMLFTNERYFMH